jgi:hypothetical protein
LLLNLFSLFASRFGDRVHCQDAITFANIEGRKNISRKGPLNCRSLGSARDDKKGRAVAKGQGGCQLSKDRVTVKGGAQLSKCEIKKVIGSWDDKKERVVLRRGPLPRDRALVKRQGVCWGRERPLL